MQIALIGYGKMGKLIEQIALQKGHVITSRITATSQITDSNLSQADVCIDFSHPHAILDNTMRVSELKKNLIVGTTGWYEHLPTVKSIVNQANIGFLYSPNFSIGVQLFFKIVKEAAALISHFPEYDVGIFEAHHKAKADSPSGTAKALADVLRTKLQRNEFNTSAMRCGSIPGTHTVMFDSLVDSICLTHQARSREGFASGAIAAAEWLNGRKGFFTLDAMLGA